MATVITKAGGSPDAATGPASATDNAIVRFDGTTGKALQDSSVTISDAGLVQFAAALTGVILGGLTAGEFRNGLSLTSDVGPGLRSNNTASEAALVLLFDLAGFNANRTLSLPDAAMNLTSWSGATSGSGVIPLVTGGLVLVGYTSSAAGASATELPADKNVSIHKNTNTGAVHLAYNDGGVIKSVQLA